MKFFLNLNVTAFKIKTKLRFSLNVTKIGLHYYQSIYYSNLTRPKSRMAFSFGFADILDEQDGLGLRHIESRSDLPEEPGLLEYQRLVAGSIAAELILVLFIVIVVYAVAL